MREILYDVGEPSWGSRPACPRLHELCVRELAVHFDAISSAGALDPTTYLEILNHHLCLASPAAVARLEAAHPELAVSDATYWRRQCNQAYAPLPELEKRIPKKVDEAALADLEKLPVSRELLRRTGIGKDLNALVKKTKSTRAKKLLDAWKAKVEHDDPRAICQTWKDLYFASSKADDAKFQQFAARAKDMYKKATADKPRARDIDPADAPRRKRSRAPRDSLSPPRKLTFQNISRPSATTPVAIAPSARRPVSTSSVSPPRRRPS